MQCKIYEHMYENAKIIPIATVPRVRERRDKGKWWMG
jgi:hypothetical protein